MENEENLTTRTLWGLSGSWTPQPAGSSDCPWPCLGKPAGTFMTQGRCMTHHSAQRCCFALAFRFNLHLQMLTKLSSLFIYTLKLGSMPHGACWGWVCFSSVPILPALQCAVPSLVPPHSSSKLCLPTLALFHLVFPSSFVVPAKSWQEARSTLRPGTRCRACVVPGCLDEGMEQVTAAGEEGVVPPEVSTLWLCS